MPAAAAPERVRPVTTAAVPEPRPSTPRPGRTEGRPAPGRPGRGRSMRRSVVASAVVVVASLLTVVGADAYLTQGQVRLTRMQQQLTSASGRHRDLEAQVATLTNPSKVVSEAERAGLDAPTKVTDLPAVSLPAPTPEPTATAPGTRSSTTAARTR